MFEGMIRTVFRNVDAASNCRRFPVMTYGEAMRRYGSDKPDLRVKLEFTELTDVMKRRRLQGLLERRDDQGRPRRRRCACRAAAR